MQALRHTEPQGVLETVALPSSTICTLQMPYDLVLAACLGVAEQNSREKPLQADAGRPQS